MTELDTALRELQGLVDREASLIDAEYRDGVAKGLPPSVAQARADVALKELWGWEKHLKQKIQNKHSTGGLPPGPVSPEPRTKPFRRSLGVMLGDLGAGQGLVDELCAAIADLATAAMIGQVLLLPPLDLEGRLRSTAKELAERLPRDLVPDDQAGSEGGVTKGKSKTRIAPGRSGKKSGETA